MIYINGASETFTTGVTYNENVITITAITTNANSSVSFYTGDIDWIIPTIISSSTSQGNVTDIIELKILTNSQEDERSAVIEVTNMDLDDISWSNSIYVIQAGEMDTMIIPAWMDYHFKRDIERLSYSIMDGNTEIYKAIAVMNPVKMDGISVNVSKIVQDYLSQQIPIDIRKITTYSSFTCDDATKDFTIYTDEFPSLTLHYINDWSYDPDNKMTTSGFYYMSKPINGHADERMLLFLTVKDPDDTDEAYVNINGYDYDVHFEKEGKVGTIVYNASYVKSEPSYEDCGKYVALDTDITYNIGYCGDYALYYRNRMGGYDSFLIEGVGKKTDEYEKYSYGRVFDNTSLQFEKSTYNLQVKTHYELNTGWLTDEQSNILANHLISSNEVYLHDLKEGKIIPVTMTDTNVEYKSYKNQGRKLVKYTINCEESQTKQIL